MQRIGTENAEAFDTSLLLQQGVWFDLQAGESVFSFGSRLLNVDLPAFNREVSTIILNHRVVDDPQESFLSPGDTLILSGAMPGLVGAMLRSDSPLKVLRDSISGSGKDSVTADHGRVLVKVFNTVLKNHKEDLLKRGFYIDGDQE